MHNLNEETQYYLGDFIIFFDGEKLKIKSDKGYLTIKPSSHNSIEIVSEKWLVALNWSLGEEKKVKVILKLVATPRGGWIENINNSWIYNIMAVQQRHWDWKIYRRIKWDNLFFAAWYCKSD